MRKVLFLALCSLMFFSCEEGKKTKDLPGLSQKDSLQRIIDQKDNEINDMMGLLNDIEEGFRIISEAENKIVLNKEGEGSDRASNIRESMNFIQQKMSDNRELIAKLQQKMRESTVKGEQLKKTIENLVVQLEEKEKVLAALRLELESKDIKIAEQDLAISSLSTDVSSLKSENERQDQTISQQDKQLNTAWYVFGTKKELKEQNIIAGGKVLQANFNKSYFTKIDIRVDKVIKLYSKSAKILTTHPSGSYTLQRDASNQYVLRVSDPQLFWSTSKYLVVQVK